MSKRRLKVVKTCAVCAQPFRPYHKTQMTCSHICGAIRRVRMYPEQYQMEAANRVNRERVERTLGPSLDGLTVQEAYKRGYLRGYRTAHKRVEREQRRVA